MKYTIRWLVKKYIYIYIGMGFIISKINCIVVPATLILYNIYKKGHVDPSPIWQYGPLYIRPLTLITVIDSCYLNFILRGSVQK